MGNGKIIGFVAGITWVMAIALMLFINSARVLFGDWFSAYALYIMIGSGIILLIGIITGTFSLRAMVKK